MNEKTKIDIGLEIHMRLNTKTKLWSGALNGCTDKPNTHLSCVDLGISGASPVLNEEAVNKAIRLAILTNCEISPVSYFDRKQYVYCDLPSGYQITQFYQPYALNGKVNIKDFIVNITEMHLESDAGKLVNKDRKVLIDYNRAGCPLVELVTGVSFSNSDQVIMFLEYIIHLVRFMNISDANLENGDLRVDVNISCRKEDGSYGMRGEIKNLNSLSAIKKAIELVQETRFTETLIQPATLQYDVNINKLSKLRDKESASDYGYMRDGTLSPLIIDQKLIDDIRINMNTHHNPNILSATELYTPDQIRTILKEKEVNNEVINILLDNMELFKFFCSLKTQNVHSINMCVGIIAAYDLSKYKNKLNNVIEYILIYVPHKLSINNANTILRAYMENTDLNIVELVTKYLINDDKNQISEIIKTVVRENSKDWEEYCKNKNEKILNVLIGKMRKIHANISIPITKELIEKEVIRYNNHNKI